MTKRASFLLWVGAAISISEIATGTLLAPLGWGRGLFVIIVGHLLGTGLLALGGLVSFRERKTAMESLVSCFTAPGTKLIAAANVVQLLGWTVIMVVQGVSALCAVFPALPFAPVAITLALLVLAWALLQGSPGQKLNEVVVVLLALLCVALAIPAQNSAPLIPAAETEQGLSSILTGAHFVAPIFLSASMPISWLPLVGDYSGSAKTRSAAVAMPFLGYFTASSLMFAFGLRIGLGGRDFFALIADSPFPLLAALVVVFSTLTTAFLDLYSAGESSRRFFEPRNRRVPILVMGLLVTAAAAFFPIQAYSAVLEGFLLTIGSVFLPIYGVFFIVYFGRLLWKKKKC